MAPPFPFLPLLSLFIYFPLPLHPPSCIPLLSLHFPLHLNLLTACLCSFPFYFFYRFFHDLFNFPLPLYFFFCIPPTLSSLSYLNLPTACLASFPFYLFSIATLLMLYFTSSFASFPLLYSSKTFFPLLI